MGPAELPPFPPLTVFLVAYAEGISLSLSAFNKNKYLFSSFGVISGFLSLSLFQVPNIINKLHHRKIHYKIAFISSVGDLFSLVNPRFSLLNVAH